MEHVATLCTSWDYLYFLIMNAEKNNYCCQRVLCFLFTSFIIPQIVRSLISTVFHCNFKSASNMLLCNTWNLYSILFYKSSICITNLFFSVEMPTEICWTTVFYHLTTCQGPVRLIRMYFGQLTIHYPLLNLTSQNELQPSHGTTHNYFNNNVLSTWIELDQHNKETAFNCYSKLWP